MKPRAPTQSAKNGACKMSHPNDTRREQDAPLYISIRGSNFPGKLRIPSQHEPKGVSSGRSLKRVFFFVFSTTSCPAFTFEVQLFMSQNYEFRKVKCFCFLCKERNKGKGSQLCCCQQIMSRGTLAWRTWGVLSFQSGFFPSAGYVRALRFDADGTSQRAVVSKTD